MMTGTTVTRLRLPPHLIVIAALAVAQAVLGLLRAVQLVRFGRDLFGRGLLIMPAVGVLTIARGALVAGIAILYLVFAWGALKHRRWASRVGLVAALLNGFAVLDTLIAGEPAVRALPWVIVPIVLLLYLLSPARSRTVGR